MKSSRLNSIALLMLLTTNTGRTASESKQQIDKENLETSVDVRRRLPAVSLKDLHQDDTVLKKIVDHKGYKNITGTIAIHHGKYSIQWDDGKDDEELGTIEKPKKHPEYVLEHPSPSHHHHQSKHKWIWRWTKGKVSSHIHKEKKVSSSSRLQLCYINVMCIIYFTI